MINRIVQFALRQRFLVLMLVGFVMIAGAISFQRMPVDAYPDLSPPMVEVITQWPGHAAEEIERLVTLPTEVEMNGISLRAGEPGSFSSRIKNARRLGHTAGIQASARSCG